MEDGFNFYKSNFFYLLVSLFLYFISTSFLTATNHSAIFVSILFSWIIFYCIFCISRQPYLVVAVVIFGTLSLILHWAINLFHLGREFYIVFYSIHILFLTAVTYAVVYPIIRYKKVTANSLFGAVCAYLLIGYTWGYIFLLIETINPAALSQPLIGSTIHESAQHAFYFSFVILTTLGFGDIVPVSNVAKTCTWFEAVIGQIYLVVWIAQLISVKITQKKMRS